MSHPSPESPLFWAHFWWRGASIPVPPDLQDWIAEQGPRVWSGHATWDEVLTQAFSSAGIPFPPPPEQAQMRLFGE
jgi:hypothetical protein